MAILRFVHRFHWREVAGWSEEIFLSSPLNLPDLGVEGYARGAATTRAAFMSKDCVVIDCLVNDVATPSVVRTILCDTRGVTGPGAPNANHDSETPLAAVRAKVSSTDGPSRVYHFRGLADADVKNGRVTWDATGPDAFNNYMRSLTDGGECIQQAVFDPEVVIDKNDLERPYLFSVPVLPDDIGIGDLIRVKTRVAGMGEKLNVYTRVKAFRAGVAPAYGSITVASWNKGLCLGGTVALFEYAYRVQNAWSTYSPNYVTYKKTGKPFSPFRGRA